LNSLWGTHSRHSARGVNRICQLDVGGWIAWVSENSRKPLSEAGFDGLTVASSHQGFQTRSW
jgi:hypothetical protein